MKEKQQEIDFLRKERDLERQRVTKAANQADQAEQSALSIKQEYEKASERLRDVIIALYIDFWRTDRYSFSNVRTEVRVRECKALT